MWPRARTPPPSTRAAGPSFWRGPSAGHRARPRGDRRSRRAGHPPGRRPDRPRRRPRGQALPHVKHFELEITDATFITLAGASRSTPRPRSTASMSRTSVSARTLPTAEVVRATKASNRLSAPSAPSRAPNSSSVRSRIHHRLEDRVHARVALPAGLLPHLAPAPSLGAAAIQDEDPPIAADPVAKANRSTSRSASPRSNAPPPANATAACSQSWPPRPLELIEQGIPEGRSVVAITDNLSTRTNRRGRPVARAHPHWRFQFTPTHASWLNQVAIFFSILQRRLIKHGASTARPTSPSRCFASSSTTSRPPVMPLPEFHPGGRCCACPLHDH